MATDSESLSHPRGLPETIGQYVGTIILSLLGGVFAIIFTTLPIIVFVLLGDVASTNILLPSLFGVYIAATIGGVRNFVHNINENDNSTTSLTDEETIDAIQENIRAFAIVIFLIAIYLNLVLIVAMWAATAIHAYSLSLSLFIPIFDKYLISIFEYSPLFLLVVALAKLIEFVSGTKNIELDMVRTTNPVATLA